SQKGEGGGIDRSAGAIGARTRRSRTQLPACVRGGVLAIRDAAGVCAVAQSVGRAQGAATAIVAAGIGDFGDYRVSAAFDARRDRASQGRGGGWCDADAGGARAGGTGGTSRSGWAPNDLWDDSVVFGVFRHAQPG